MGEESIIACLFLWYLPCSSYQTSVPCQDNDDAKDNDCGDDYGDDNNNNNRYYYKKQQR